MSVRIRLLRDAGSKTATLELLAGEDETREDRQEFLSLNVEPGPWILHAADAGLPEVRAQGNGLGSFPLLAAGRRHMVFTLEMGGRSCSLAERHLPMTGGFNLRDLGGFVGKKGQRVVWGRILRGDDLKSLTPADEDYLLGLPLRTVVDFRIGREIARYPDRLPRSVECYFPRSISPGRHDADADGFTQEEADLFMTDIYRHLVRDEDSIAVYRDLFQLLQERENRLPLLFHCSAGKDRTGLAAALILHSLGVSQEDILADYLSSRRYLAGKYSTDTGIFSVRPAYLQAAFAEIIQIRGSIDAYLRDVLGVNRKRMHRLYLDDSRL